MKHIVLIFSLLTASAFNFANGEFEDLQQEIKLEIAKHFGFKELLILSDLSKIDREQFNPRWKEIFENLFSKDLIISEKIYLLGKPQTDDYIDWKSTLIKTLQTIVAVNEKQLYLIKALPWKVSLTNRLFVMANFSKKNLKNCCINKANLKFANFSKANISGVYIFKSDLSNANLSGAKVTDRSVNFFNSNLSNANLSGTHFYKFSSFSGSNLFNAQLTNSTCIRCDFSKSNLSNINLANTDISKAFFKDSYYEKNGKKEPVTLEYLKERGAYWKNGKDPDFNN